jgi:hypothetical protein
MGASVSRSPRGTCTARPSSCMAEQSLELWPPSNFHSSSWRHMFFYAMTRVSCSCLNSLMPKEGTGH